VSLVGTNTGVNLIVNERGGRRRGGACRTRTEKKKGIWSKINQIDIQSYIYIFNVVYGGSKGVAG